jgi:putative glutamine amidotransferase
VKPPSHATISPRIGVVCALEPARWSVWDQEAVLAARTYVNAVLKAGGLPLMLAPTDDASARLDGFLDSIDGLVLIGGVDVEPEFYGAERHPFTIDPVPERDRFEIPLVRRAIEWEVPLLGVCRGMQVLNVAMGGTLHQHLPEVLHDDRHRRVVGSFAGADHEAQLVAGSLAARTTGVELATVKSHHHQGVDRLGEGLRITGRCPEDELPEAIELPGHRYCLGVQWHPEEDGKSTLIGSLVEAAATRGRPA